MSTGLSARRDDEPTMKGTRMTEQQSTPKPEGDPKATEAKPESPKAAEESLGEGGKKALEAERSARQQAETDLKALRSEFDGFKSSLSEAFGVKPATGDGSDALKTMQEQLNQMQRDTSVYRLAAQHSITDEEDLELLRSAKDEAAMTKLAGRLAAKADEKPGIPKPDSTQGGGHGTPPALNSDGLEQALKSKLGIN
jgi:hypothetical protein